MRTLFVVFIMFLCTSTNAWNPRGHMIVAAIAYQSLTKQNQATIADLLQQHPEYHRKWRQGYHHLTDDVELGLYLFMQASVWPDEIRDINHPQHHLDAPKWHYMNYKLTFPFDEVMDIVDQDNVLHAIKTCLKTYRSKTTANKQKAIALSWIAHLIGDVHQPLHSASLFSEQYPKGDRGGNDFWIKSNETVNLHYYWDGLLGRSTKVRSVLNEAIKLNQHWSTEIIAFTDDSLPHDWSLESFKIAREKVYLDGKLKGGTDKGDAQQVPNNYGSISRTVAEQRVVAAGYRLANNL